MVTGETITVTIHMAGDIETAKRWLRRRCYERGLCVTVSASDFIYTGGEEAGFLIGFVNYPRFPSDIETLRASAVEVANALVIECCQKTALVVAPDRTEWIQVAPPGASS